MCVLVASCIKFKFETSYREKIVNIICLHRSAELSECLLALGVEVLVEERGVDEALVELLALVHLAEHELAAESIIFVQ